MTSQRTLRGLLIKNRKLIMYSLLLCCALFLLLSATNAKAAGPTYVTGDITTDTIWTEANSPYVVTNNITVAEGVTLTVQANVTVKVNYATTLTINGNFVANGAAGQMVNLTKNTTTASWAGISWGPKSNLNWNYVYFNNVSGSMTVRHNAFINNSKFVDVTGLCIYLPDTNDNITLTVINSYFSHTGYGGGSGVIFLDMNIVALENETKTYTIPITIENNVFKGGQTTDAITLDISATGSWASATNVVAPMSFKGNTFADMATNLNAFRVIRTINAYENATIAWTGDVIVESNTFNDCYCGIWISDEVNANSKYNNAGSMSSNFAFIGNTVDNAGYPAYRDVEIRAHGQRSVTHTGNFVMTDNEILCRDYVFGLDQNLYAWDNGTASFTGDITVARNVVTDADYVIYVDNTIDQYGAYNTTGSITGAINVNNNTITNCNDYAVYIYWNDIDVNGYGDATINVPITIVDNYQDDGGDYFVYQEQYYYTSDNATLIINSPTIITHNQFRHGYGMYYLDNYWESNDKSVITSTTPYTIVENIGLFSNDAINVYEVWGTSYDASIMTLNCDMQVTNNNFVTRNGYDLYMERGFEAEDDSVQTANMLVNVQNNIFESEDYDGVYIEDYVYAYYDVIGAQLTVNGNVQIWDNFLKVAGGDAIYYYIETDAESDVYGSNTVMNLSAVNWIIKNNTVSMYEDSGYAIGWESEMEGGTGLYISGGNLSFVMGDVLITDNLIDVTGDSNDAIFLNVDVSAEAFSGSTATVIAGDFLANKNTITITGDDNDGINLYVDYFFAEGYQANVTMICGEISANDNDISVVGNGNNALNLDPDSWCIYAEAYGDHDFSVAVYVAILGGYNANGNVILMDGTDNIGIYLDDQYTYADSADYMANATVMMNINIMDNIVEITDRNHGTTISLPYNYGMKFDGWEVKAQYATSHSVAISNLLVKGNIVTDDGVNDYGMYINEFNVVPIDESDFIGQAWIYSSTVFVDNSFTGGYIGINVISGDFNVELTTNIVSGTYDTGINFDSATGTVKENVVCDNFGDGIYIDGSTGVVLDDNNICDNFGYGLYIYDSNATIINGRFVDNSNAGVYVSGSDVTWIVDKVAEVRSNDVQFAGYITVVDGGVFIIDLAAFDIDDAYTGITKIMVEHGGEMNVRNVDFDADGSMPGQFLVDGKLTMISCSMMGWEQLYLGPTSTAGISASNFFGEARYGIFVDNASPRIANCLFVECDLAGIFVQGQNANPSIENCVFLLNERGIYARDANLGDAISNVFVGNLAAGIYGEGITGKINANTFLLNKVEIFLVDSSVSVEDNEIGYAHLIDVLSGYTPAMSVLMNYAMDVLGMMNMTDVIPIGTPTAPTPDMVSLLASLLVDHDGIMAKNSTVICKGNTYGLVSWAVYAERSTIVFSDVVKQNDLVFSWLNSDMVSAKLSIPVQAMDGIYARNSQVTISGATIEVLDTAVFLSNSNANITNSQLLADKFDIYATGTSTVKLSGTVLDGKLKADGDAVITASFILDIVTMDSNQKIKGGVHVVVKNAQGVVVAEGDSDANGHFLCSVVAYKLINGNKDASMNPYTVNVEFKNGAVSQDVSVSEATALNVLANKDNTAMYAGIVVLAIAILVIGLAVLMRRK
jgi:hypothetical protein